MTGNVPSSVYKANIDSYFPLSYSYHSVTVIKTVFHLYEKEWLSTFISSPFFLFNFLTSNDKLIIHSISAVYLETLGLLIY